MLTTEPYVQQRERWPREGRHILAQFDDATVVVYQAFRASTAEAAVRAGAFSDGFSLDRMSWIKPNFLWMMYRCGWATKADQERVLAITMKREGFDAALSAAVHSSHVPGVYETHAAWERAVKGSDVRLQWDPDHDPHGQKAERRAIQLGLRGEALRRYAREWTASIEDVTDFVRAQHRHVTAHALDELLTPREDVYPVRDAEVRARLGISAT